MYNFCIWCGSAASGHLSVVIIIIIRFR